MSPEINQPNRISLALPSPSSFRRLVLLSTGSPHEITLTHIVGMVWSSRYLFVRKEKEWFLQDRCAPYVRVCLLTNIWLPCESMQPVENDSSVFLLPSMCLWAKDQESLYQHRGCAHFTTKSLLLIGRTQSHRNILIAWDIIISWPFVCTCLSVSSYGRLRVYYGHTSLMLHTYE